MAVINTNAKALFSQTALKQTDRSMSVAMQQLSTGKRINSARDDAAGLSIVTRMTHQIRSLNQAVRNAGDAINLIQTAEGATTEITDMMQRMRELAIQAVNDTNSNTDRSSLDLEFQQLKQQIVQIADNTEWNGFSVLNGKAGQQVGEMPLFKVTSDNHYGGVFIQPTTSKTFAGNGAGEVQQFELAGVKGAGEDFGKLNISGVEVDLTSAATLADAADTIKQTLNTASTMVKNGVSVIHSVPKVEVKSGPAVDITFTSMQAHQTVTVQGRTFTAARDLTGAEVAGIFEDYFADETGLAATDGSFDGTAPASAAFDVSGSATGAKLTFNGTASGSPVVSGSISMVYSGADGDVEPAMVVRTSGALRINGVVDEAQAATTVREAVTIAEESIADTDPTDGNPNTEKYLQSGSLKINISSLAAVGDSTSVTAVFTNSDNQSIELTGTLSDLSPATVVFKKADGFNSQVISGDLTFVLKGADKAGVDLSTDPRAISMTVGVEGSIPRMREGDLTINGVSVGPSLGVDDQLSPRNNAAGSAIAIAAAINRLAVNRGVTQGEIQSLTFTGQPKPGVITVGGVSVVLTSAENTPALATALIAAKLKASTQFDENSGRTVSYAPGSSTLSISYPASEGDVSNIDVTAGHTELGSVVNVTQEYATQRAGTGVFAKVNENVFSGQRMVSGPVATGTVFINGYASANIASVFNNSQATRENTVRAINLISEKTGVKAIDTGSDEKGIQLVAIDGRNIEVRFETTGSTNAVSFGQRIGMREGVQSSSISLESKIQTPVILGSVPGGDIRRAGLAAGDYSRNQAVQNTSPRDPVDAAKPQISIVRVSSALTLGNTATVVVNGVSFTSDDTLTSPADITNDLIDQINNDPTLGVYAAKGNSLGDISLTSKTPGLSFTLSASATQSDKVSANLLQASQNAQTHSLGASDLTINGVPIRSSRDSDDIDSNTWVNSSDPSASAIALAAAINDSTSLTGVKAFANPAETVGSITTTTDKIEGMQSLWVNGTEIKVEFKQNDDGATRRANVVKAINERTGQHGVVATDNGRGVTLSTKDGRNLSVWFDSSVKDLDAADFGLSRGGEVAQKSLINFGTISAGAKVSVVINGQLVSATAGANKAATASALLTAINTALDGTNLHAQATADSEGVIIVSDIPGSGFDLRLSTETEGDVSISTSTLNSSGQTNVSAVNMSDKDYVENVLHGKIDPLTNRISAEFWGKMSVQTVYGTVRLVSDAAVLPSLPGADGITPSSLNGDGRPIQIRAGGAANGSLSNFMGLGFQEGSFGGRASTDMDPPRVGRMAFQVGAGANQYITIDLADFGKKGPITGDITGDVDQAADQRSVRINTREGAQAVLALLDSAMDKVNATRATMGAVMNRLDHVITNLNNVSMNLSASRSQVEDADYAKASTDLARAQILQQAATAVLAQANTSQQSVLKLLGGG